MQKDYQVWPAAKKKQVLRFDIPKPAGSNESCPIFTKIKPQTRVLVQTATSQRAKNNPVIDKEKHVSPSRIKRMANRKERFDVPESRSWPLAKPPLQEFWDSQKFDVTGKSKDIWMRLSELKIQQQSSDLSVMCTSWVPNTGISPEESLSANVIDLKKTAAGYKIDVKDLQLFPKQQGAILANLKKLDSGVSLLPFQTTKQILVTFPMRTGPSFEEFKTGVSNDERLKNIPRISIPIGTFFACKQQTPV